MLKRLISGFVCAYAVCAHTQDRVAKLTYRDFDTRPLISQFHSAQKETARAGWSLNHLSEGPFENEWCKHLSYTWWSNSKHPGYRKVSQLNSNQDGIGFVCRRGGSHPTFFGVDTMTNSVYGATIAASIGKDLDLVDYNGFKYYVGAAATALTYEIPAKHQTLFGVVPIRHRGVSIDLVNIPSPVRSFLPIQVKGVLGWRELTLPKDDIRVRAWQFELRGTF